MRILEECLNAGTESVLIFEDDALFPDDFTSQWKLLKPHVPDDWGMLYLGGQHLMRAQRQPKMINDHIVQPYNVNRTHAYAVNQRLMETLYRHLNAITTWRNRHHIDHHYGLLHMTGKHNVYAPVKWLVGRVGG